MMNAFLFISKPVKGDNVAGISVSDFSKGTIFSFFDSLCSLKVFTLQGISNLDICIVSIFVSCDKIAFQFSDFSNTNLIIMTC